MAKRPTSPNAKDKTPPKWSGPTDARTHDNAGEYPNYQVWKTRTGHVFMMDDSRGAEHITLQHRSGSMLQLMPDGAVQLVSHNGRYTFTFGEDRMIVTGAQDVTVQGGASLRVEKDMNMTVMGDYNTTVDGNFNLTAKNFSGIIRGNMDVTAKNITTKVEGATEISSHGTTTVSGDEGVAIASTVGSVGIVSALAMGLRAFTEIMMQADGAINIKGADAITAQSEGAFGIKSGADVAIQAGGTASIKGDPVALEGSQVLLNSGGAIDAPDAKDAEIVLTPIADPNEDRTLNAEITMVFGADDNNSDDDIENTTTRPTDITRPGAGNPD